MTPSTSAEARKRMNRHVGASFTLSVLVVVFFAVVLYEPEHSRHPHPAAGTASPAGPKATPAATPPSPTPGVPLTEAVPDAVPEPGSVAVAPASPPPARATSPDPEPPPRVTAARSRPYAARADRPSMIQVASNRRPAAPARRSAFTQVVDGESLADVAVRIYGTSDAAGALWRANRDILDRRDAALQAGTLLRTP